VNPSTLNQDTMSKACGPDGITPYLLKIAAEFIAPSLSKLMNASLNSGVLLFDWLSANIVPIHKRNDKHLPENYRPISLTSVVVKVMERLVYKPLYSSMHSQDLISDIQCGFQQKKSTTALLLQAVDDWSVTLEQHSTVHWIFPRHLTQCHMNVYF